MKKRCKIADSILYFTRKLYEKIELYSQFLENKRAGKSKVAL